MSKTNGDKKITRNLKCVLTQDEIRQYGIELARENAMRDEAEQRKTEVTAQIKAEIESHETRGQNLSRKINNGYEYRDVECLIQFHYKTNTVTVVRTDSKELVEERAMTDDERQTALNI